MIVLGVDGGSRRAGVAVVQHGDEPMVLAARLIRMDVQPWTDRVASERLHFLFTSVAALTREWRPDLVCVEHIRVRNGGKHRNLDAYLIAAKSQQSAVLGALHGADAAGAAGMRVVEVMASQVRARLRVKAKTSDDAKTETRRLFNRICELDLRLCGFDGPPDDGPVPHTMTDVTDALALAWTAPWFVAHPETIHA